MSIKVGLFGFGRTGSLVAKEIVNDPELDLAWVCRKTITSHFKYAGHALGFDEERAPFIEEKNFNQKFIDSNPVDLVIDFSSGQNVKNYDLLAKNNIKIVSAISEYTDEEHRILDNSSQNTALLHSPNITLGINWLLIASKVLKKFIPHADVEIVEEHFRDKKSTSGTALKIAEQLGLDSKKHVNSIRVGGVVGTHEVVFGLPYQTIRLTHESISRSAFGTGAIFAGKWLMKKPNGLYKMEQMFHEKFSKHLDNLNF